MLIEIKIIIIIIISVILYYICKQLKFAYKNNDSVRA